MEAAVGDVNKARNGSAQVQQGMHLHRGLGLAEDGPRKYRQAQVDGGGVERIDGVVEIHPERLAGVELPGATDQVLGKLGTDAPVAARVGIGQGGTSYWLAQPHVIELLGLRCETALDVALSLPVKELSEGHDAELLGAGQRADAMVAVISLHNAEEDRPRQEVHQFGLTVSCRCTSVCLGT